MKFGDILRNLLDERSLSQKELAGALNMAPSTLGNYIRNEREADYETLKVFARYFGVSVDYLLDFPQKGVLCFEESELLHSFRSLTPEHKSILIDFSRILLKRSLQIDSER
jgi:transcriptional regulator with XRE-family HTH domain